MNPNELILDQENGDYLEAWYNTEEGIGIAIYPHDRDSHEFVLLEDWDVEKLIGFLTDWLENRD
jgi:hypothetical protein